MTLTINTTTKPKRKLQSEWIVSHLTEKGMGGDFVLNMMREWNLYKSQNISHTHKCNYASFRKTIYDFSHGRYPLIVKIPRNEKTSLERDVGTIYERSYYRLLIQ